MVRYFKYPTPSLNPARELSEKEAEQYHLKGIGYTVADFLAGVPEWSLMVTPKRGACSARFYDSEGRTRITYTWEDRSARESKTEEGALLVLGQAFAHEYLPGSDKWSRKAAVYVKRSGQIWRRYFDKDAQASEDVVDEDGAQSLEISKCFPVFGEYETFRSINVDPVYSWLTSWPVQFNRV